MRKILVLLCAAGMLLGFNAGAQAVDLKAKGQWVFGFEVLPGFPWVTPVRNWPGRGLDRHRRSRWLS